MAISKKKKQRIDRQILRIVEFHHRNPARQSGDVAPPFDYLAPSEMGALNFAFEGFDLNINDPAQRDYLLAMLAFGIFGQEGESHAGRPRGSKAWDTAAKLKLRHQINSAIKSIVEETGKMPRTMWTIVERISPGSRQANGNLYNRVCELYRLQKNKKK
jgi:hypothetical protein